MNPLLAPAVFGEKRGVEPGVKQSSSESWNGRERSRGDRPGCPQEAATTGRDWGPVALIASSTRMGWRDYNGLVDIGYRSISVSIGGAQGSEGG